jgi:crossover junction endodeoxyribonuclease RuvC
MGVTPQQFEQMKNRVNGKARSAKSPTPILANPFPPVRAHEIIIGIDPSLRGTGYGVIRLSKPFPETLAHGTISCPQAWEHSRCLVKIVQILRDVLKQHPATVCAIEGLFFAQNLQTALTMGEARGAALVAVGEAGLEIFEISPRKVKQAIVGYGAAQKTAVAKMVQRMLRLEELPAPDAADALALALAHAQSSSRFNLSASKRI